MHDSVYWRLSFREKNTRLWLTLTMEENPDAVNCSLAGENWRSWKCFQCNPIFISWGTSSVSDEYPLSRWEQEDHLTHLVEKNKWLVWVSLQKQPDLGHPSLIVNEWCSRLWIQAMCLKTNENKKKTIHWFEEEKHSVWRNFNQCCAFCLFHVHVERRRRI